MQSLFESCLNLLCVFNILFFCDHQATQLNSSIGRTYTVNALINSLASRDKKHLSTWHWQVDGPSQPHCQCAQTVTNHW